MGDIYFYHLTETPLEATLPQLLHKALGAGWRIELRGTDAQRIDFLDKVLWERPEDGFLPHGRAGALHESDQPILLTLGDEAQNNPVCIMSVDGAEIRADEAKSMERICILFDGADGDAVAHAREQWRGLTSDGCSAQYWAQEDGRWVKKAETAA